MWLSSVPVWRTFCHLKGVSASHILRLGLCLLLSLLAESNVFVVHADPMMRTVSDVLIDGLESETLDEWNMVGEPGVNRSSVAAGTLRYGEGVSQVSGTHSLWVDGVNGDDANDGLTTATAFRTIQRAADLAGPGTTVHIEPGIYREMVWPARDGDAGAPITFVAEDGPGTVVIRGSEPASSLTWTQLEANTIGLPPDVEPTRIYYADLSAWGPDSAPRFVVELDRRGEVIARLPLAREPDWEVVTEWKHHEFWWAAEGGWNVAGCDPSTDPDPDCDRAWRSRKELTDRTDDSDPSGVEPGNLTTLGDLTGATLVALDANQGHYVYRRTIVAHDVVAGHVTVHKTCDNGLGWGSKYYVENHPRLLDTPGEWWYDEGDGRLYLWPRTPGNVATMNVEISRRDVGFKLDRRSYVTLDGLTLEFFNGSAVYQANGGNMRSYDNTVRNAILRYVDRGVSLMQGADGPAGNVTAGFTLENSEIAYADTNAIYFNYWWDNQSAADSFTHAGIVNTIIRGNELHHLGFRSSSDTPVGASLQHTDKLRFENNHVHHVAHNGIQFSRSVIQSPREWGFSPDDIKTGEILIKDNIFEKACQLGSDCGALKIWGDPPDRHVFRDVLVTGNVFRDTFGWAYVLEERRRSTNGTSSDMWGMNGFGLYVDMASGIHAYRNVAYNNGHAGFKFAGLWRDGDMVYYDNIAANSRYGFYLGGTDFDTHGSVNAQVVNNIIVNNEGYGILQCDADGRYDNMVIDHNLYYNNGWRAREDGGWYKPGAMAIQQRSSSNKYYPGLADIQAHTAWESHGVEGPPRFQDYDPLDHDLHDGSWPDFRLTASSTNAIDRGTAALPASLAALLDAFDVDGSHWGHAFDIGAFEYELGFGLSADLSFRAMDPGGTVTYVIEVAPVGGFADAVTLVVASSSPSLVLSLAPTIIHPPGSAILTVADTHVGAPLPGVWHTVSITGTGGGFAQSMSVKVLVGGSRAYFPLVARSN
jgi:hypothetical protein